VDGFLMQNDLQTLELVRGQVPAIVLGSVFAFVGVVALAISAVRHRERMRILLWFGLFSAIYGVRMLAESTLFLAMFPRALLSAQPYIIAVLTYVILVPALLVWFDLSVGGIRKFVKVMIWVAAVVGIAGIATAFITGKTFIFMPANNAIAIVFTLIIAVVNVVPALARRYLIIQSRVLAAGSLILAVVALEVNLASFLPIRRWGNWEPVAFGAFVLAIGYVAVERVLINERRLVSIEQELAVAREIQASILPSSAPDMPGLRIAAAYHPMASVAGDFYEFVQLDQTRAGFLIADVSGHGVPAALIASMIKVAMHAVQSCAENPSEVVRGLNRILTQQLNGQFVTSAYLFLDTRAKVARYAAAGHPPMLHWSASNVGIRKVESNGLLFGVLKDTEYPCSELPLSSGDRFVLYTDGLTEPENPQGEAFGDNRILDLMRESQSASAAELSSMLFRESNAWQPANTPQQDDVSLLVIDVL
jgi:phosphoserine phosphatase RsbU/P